MGKRILVADSDSVVQQVASYFLKLEGFDVEAVGDGVSAMEAIEKTAPDVIVMTPVLSGINGIEVSHFVREKPQYKNIPVIFLAESEEPLLNNIPDLSRQFGVVTKPIDPTRLVNTIKEYLEKGPAAAEDIRESLKSIEEILGWEVSEKKTVPSKEEVLQEKTRTGSLDVTELLSCGLTKEDENPVCHPEPVETAENIEADLKSRVTDEMIENMIRKIAVDIVERVTREIVPDIAEREITKEIERLKGTE